MTNRELAQYDPAFRAACEMAGVHPSRQQFRKWKHGRGAAFIGQNGSRRETRSMPALDSSMNNE